jgi:hypothetical protein
MTDEKSHLFPVSSLGAFESQSRNSNSFTPSVVNKVDCPVDFPPHIGTSTTSRPNDVKSAGPSNIDYMTPEYVSSPVDEQLNLKASQPQTSLSIASAGSFNPWTSFPPGIFSPVDYGGGPNQGVPQQQLLHHQVSLLPTGPQSHGLNTHQPPGLLPVPDLHGARPPPQFADLPLGAPAFRTGSLNHPHLMQQRDSGIGGPMHQFK